MSVHSYSRCWLHMIWATLSREKMLTRDARKKLSAWLDDYSKSKGIYMRTNYVNADHAHALIDLPTNKTIEDVAHLFKGASSHWVNEQRLADGRFAWGRGYGAFSVSHSNVPKVVKYIA